jgi:MFS family permease
VRRLAAARLASVVGSSAAYVALVYSVYDLTGSAVLVTVALLVTTGVQSVILPYASGLGDRFSRKAVLMASDCASGGLFLSLVVLRPSPAVLLVVAGLASVAEAPFLPASSAIVPQIATPALLHRANGITAAAAAAGRAIGPVVAGTLYAVADARAVFGLNAASFVVSAALIAPITVRRSDAAGSGARSGLADAVRHVRRTPAIRLLLTSSLLAYVATSFGMVAEPFLAESFGVGGAGYGAMSAGWGAGVVIGAWVAGRTVRGGSEAVGALAGRLVMGGGLTGVALSNWFPLVPVFLGVGGIGSGVLLVALQSHVQRATPDEWRSKVFGVFESVGTASFVGGVLLAGVAVRSTGPRTAFGIAAAGTLLAAVPLVVNLRHRSRAVPAGAG